MRAKFLTENELSRLRAAMTSRAWLPYQIAIETGLRVGDVAKLAWHDLQGNRLSYTAQKTGKPGTAILENSTAEALWKERTTALSPWMFPAPKDGNHHISRQLLWKRLKAAAKKAGLNMVGISPHSLRKVYGVNEYHAHGMNAARVGLQHTDMSTTEIYVLSDWLTGENANAPLLRSDLARILRYVSDWLGIPKDAPQT